MCAIIDTLDDEPIVDIPRDPKVDTVSHFIEFFFIIVPTIALAIWALITFW
jgi:hypothetical protein